MKDRKIFVALSTYAQNGSEPLDLLKNSQAVFTVNSLGRRLVKDEIVAMGKGCHGIIAGIEPYDESVLERMTELKCISRCGVGIENINVDKAGQKGIKILNTPDAVIRPVAELTVALVFDLIKHLSWHSQRVKSGKWEKKAGQLLKGKRIGIIGLGNIGRETALLFKGLGTQVYGSDPRAQNDWAGPNGITILPTDKLLRESDIVSLHLCASDEHPFRLGERELFSMKKGACLVNVARGQFVDEKALLKALKEDHLGGAALDVYSQEPYHGPLCGLDNVILTPHIATLTRESRCQMELEATKNLLKFLDQGS